MYDLGDQTKHTGGFSAMVVQSKSTTNARKFKHLSVYGLCQVNVGNFFPCSLYVKNLF